MKCDAVRMRDYRLLLLATNTAFELTLKEVVLAGDAGQTVFQTREVTSRIFRRLRHWITSLCV